MSINENEIEKVLRQSPSPKPDAGLKQRLTAEIRLPKEDETGVLNQGDGWIGFLRRWWPALAPAAVSMVCVAVMASQRMEVRELRQENAQLAEQRTVLVSARPAEAENDSRPVFIEEQEIARLKERAVQLRTEIIRLEGIQVENEKLRKQPVLTSGLSEGEIAAVSEARQKAMSMQCINHLKQIGLATHVWAQDNQDVWPPDYPSMSNELNTPKILVCPADTDRMVATSFAQYSDANASYEYLAPSATNAAAEPSRVLTRCPIHGHIGLCDGSVQGHVAKNRPDLLIWRDKKLYLEESKNAQSAKPDKRPKSP